MANLFDINAPRALSYGPPNMAEQLYNMIGGLPDQYHQGVEQAYKRRLMAPYEIPTKDGQFDYAAMLRDAGRIGGAGEAIKMAPQIRQQQMFEELNKPEPWETGAGPTTPTPSARGASTANQPSYNMTPQAGAGRGGAAEPTFDSSRERDQRDTVRQLATERGINVDAPGFAAQFGGKAALDQPLSSDEAQTVVAAFGDPQKIANLQQSGMFGPVGMPMTPRQVQPQPTTFAQAFPGAQMGAPATTPTQAPQRGAAPDPAANLLPSGYPGTSVQYLDWLRKKAEAYKLAGLDPKPFEDRAQKIMEAHNEAAKQTRQQELDIAKSTDPRMQEAQARKEQLSEEIKQSVTKKEPGIQQAGDMARMARQQIGLLRTEMSKPNFFTGAGNEFVNRLREWQVTLGGDPNKATPNQTFNKVTLNMLNDQIKAMTQAGVARVQIREIENLKDALASKKITPSTNRLLLEEVDRVSKFTQDIQRMATDYKRAGHTHLDAGFDRVVQDYYEQPGHQLFTKQELAHPELIAPPYLPSAVDRDPAKKKQWAANQGISKGDPFLADGPDPRLPPGPDNVRHLRAW